MNEEAQREGDPGNPCQPSRRDETPVGLEDVREPDDGNRPPVGVQEPDEGGRPPVGFPGAGEGRSVDPNEEQRVRSRSLRDRRSRRPVREPAEAQRRHTR